MFKEMFKEPKELNEKTKYKIYYTNKELWVAYGQSSGTTSYWPDLSKFISNKTGDKEYDSNVDKIVQFAKENTAEALKTNKSKTAFLFELPVYPTLTGYGYYGGTFDVWGGDIKPIKSYYMFVSTFGVAVVNIFTKKAEALAWMRSTV